MHQCFAGIHPCLVSTHPTLCKYAPIALQHCILCLAAMQPVLAPYAHPSPFCPQPLCPVSYLSCLNMKNTHRSTSMPHVAGQAPLGHSVWHATHVLQAGQLVAVPTETVYGLAANALDAAAVARIYAAKGRPASNPLIVHIASLDRLGQVALPLSPAAQSLAEAFWPGPLTLVVPKAPGIPAILTAEHATVAVRMPGHPLALALLHALPFPLAAPSANPSGRISPTAAEHVAQAFTAEQVAYVLDGGPARLGLESTIVGFDGDGRAEVLRLGAVPLEDLALTLGYEPYLQTTPGATRHDAPGMRTSHYAPTVPLKLGHLPDLLAAHAHLPPERIGVLALRKTVPGIPQTHQALLSPNGFLPEAARKLFAAMRRLDALPIDVILAERVPDEGIGRAINDRLERAAA